MADPHGRWHWRALGLTMAARSGKRGGQRKASAAMARRVTKQPKVPPPSMVPVRRASRARRPGH